MADSNRVGAPSLARLLSGWDDTEAPLHTGLTDALRRVIASGGLSEGAILPSQRLLAQTLAVSRTTVATAYNNLQEEGWLGARHGGVTWVRLPNPVRHSGWQGDRLTSYAEHRGPYDLASGSLLATHLLPRILHGPWLNDVIEMLDTDGYAPLGWSALRVGVAKYFDGLGLPTQPDQLLITNGAHNALSLAAEAILGAGDVVLVEDPTYRGSFDVFGRLGARVVGVRTDHLGIDPAHLREQIHRHRPRLLYVMPAAHNATGITWTDERRTAVAEIATNAELTVLDDASTSDLQIDLPRGDLVGPLGVLLPDHLSVTIGSTTKLYWAGLRVGWVRGPAHLIEAVLRTRLTLDITGSLPSQVLAARCLENVAEARLVRRAELKQSRADAIALLTDHLPTRTCRLADGSTLWVDTGIEATSLCARLRRRGILLNAGPTFSISEGFTTHVRMPLGHRDALFAAIPLMAEVLHDTEAQR